jgi:UDP-N-acetylglucosamine acyltransferase
VHQFVNIGIHSFIGGGSLVRKDVPPFVKAAREPLSYVGINGVGLRRRGFSTEKVKTIQDIYRVLYVKDYNVKQAFEIIQESFPQSDEKSTILEFIQQSNRGLMRGFSRLS